MNKDYFNKYIKYKLKYLNLKDVSINYENDIKDDNFEKCNLDNFKIDVYEDFLTKEECNVIIELARPLLERSGVVQENSVSDDRTSTGVFLKTNMHPVLEKISKKVSEITNIPIENQEDIQVVNYQKGQYYNEHYDECFEDTKECKESSKSGRRKNTFFIYLNNVEKGGFTGFPNISKKVIPKLGRAVSWNNILESDGNIINDPCSLHIGIKPDQGEKWALTVWSRDRKFEHSSN
tara:strand:+ start:1030 stop:1734 length:705 start_codon:yes stop_codon:yes gene_type:complete